MSCFRRTIDLQSHGGQPSFIDITDQVREVIDMSGIDNGIVVVNSAHTTCSIYFDEFAHDCEQDGTDFLQKDLNERLRALVPDQVDFPPADGYHYPGEKHYEAVESWPDAEKYLPGNDRSQLLNADAHIKASILGSSGVYPIIDGKLGCGVTGYIFFVDFDRTRPRQRRCHISVIG